MATKRHSKQLDVGILIQPEAVGAATTYKSTGNNAESWDNPGAANENYRRVFYDAASVIPEPNVKVDVYNTTGYTGILKESDRKSADATTGLKRVTFAGPLDIKTLAFHLAGSEGLVSEGATTPYSKDFTWAGQSGLPDFTNDGFPLHTVYLNPGASADDGIILQNAILDELELSYNFLGEGLERYWQISGTWVGYKLLHEQTLSGTPSAGTFTPSGKTDTFSMTTFTVGGVDYSGECIRRFSYRTENNTSVSCVGSSGYPANYDIAPMHTTQIILDYNSTTEKLLKDLADNAQVVVDFRSSLSSSTDGYLKFDLKHGVLTSNPYTYEGDYLGVALDIEWYQIPATGGDTITLVDTQDMGY